MNIFRDLRIDDDGDLVIGPDGDLILASPYDTAVQDVVNRIRTNDMESFIHPHFGSNIQSRIGRPNNRVNGEWIRNSIMLALTRDGRFTTHEVTVDVVPVGVESVAIIVFLNTINYEEGADLEPTVLSFEFNYNTGEIERITD